MAKSTKTMLGLPSNISMKSEYEMAGFDVAIVRRMLYSWESGKSVLKSVFELSNAASMLSNISLTNWKPVIIKVFEWNDNLKCLNKITFLPVSFEMYTKLYLPMHIFLGDNSLDDTSMIHKPSKWSWMSSFFM